MRLTFFEARHLRRFADGVRIDQFEPGINVFSGPNGAGKSSIIRALQAAFVERYQTRNVDDLVPWAAPGASPSVQVHFDHDNKHYELHKQFLKGRFARLQADGSRLDNVEADDALASLLGYRLASKGLNKSDNLGIPGLLWIAQGSGQLLEEPLTSARQYLRDALAEHVGELTTTDGDAVLEQIRSQRNELLAVNSEKPKGEYERAVRSLAAVSAKVKELHAEQTRYGEMVDELARLRKEEQRAGAEQPWQSIAQQLALARQALSSGEALRIKADQVRSEKQRLTSEITLLQAQLQARKQQQELIEQRRKSLQQAEAEESETVDFFKELTQRREAGQRELREQRVALDIALRHAQRRSLQRDLDIQREALVALEQQLQHALDLQERISTVRLRVPATPVDPADTDKVRQLDQELSRVRAQQHAQATRLKWTLTDQQSVAVDGQPITGNGERMLNHPTRVMLPGVGELLISPGGADHLATESSIARTEQDRHVLLGAYGVESAQELERLHQRQTQDQREIQLLEQQLKQFAPDGLDQLRDRVAAARLQVDQLADTIASQPAETGANEDAQQQPDALRAAMDDLQQQVTRAEQRWQETRTRVALAGAARQAAAQELAELQVSCPGQTREQEESGEKEKLTLLSAELEQRNEQLCSLETELAQLRLDALEQDIERLVRSEQAARSRYDHIVEQCRTLEGRLSEAGTKGTGERIAIEEAEQSRLTRRVAQFDQQSKALNLLLKRLEAARQQATEQLLAPLRKHLDHYLGLLFPGATLDMNEQLSPTRFLEGQLSQAVSGDFADQSFGTREQLSLITRLAYADLLKLAGRPTLVILDDGLVHSDRDRLQHMKRILFDASDRHQVLIFTCHQERWQDLGAPIRDVRDLVLGQSAAS